MTEREELLRLAVVVAERCDETGNPRVGAVIRRLVRLVLETPEPAAVQCCPGCGAEIVQPATGRPRVWCSPRCRRRGSKEGRKRMMEP